MSRRLIAFIAALALSASAAGAETWKVGSQDSFVPYNFVQDGEYTGIDVEILESAANSINVTLRHFPTTWRRALLDFEAGKLDALFQLTPTHERFRKWHMVGPIRTTQTVFMTRTDSQIVDIKGLPDLSDLVVGVVAGYTYGHKFDDDPQIEKEPSVDDFTNVRKLLLGRSDVIIGGRETLNYIVRELNAQDKVRILPTPLTVRDRYVAFHKTPEGLDKARRLQAQLDKMADDGVLQAIINRFLLR